MEIFHDEKVSSTLMIIGKRIKRKQTNKSKPFTLPSAINFPINLQNHLKNSEVNTHNENMKFQT